MREYVDFTIRLVGMDQRRHHADDPLFVHMPSTVESIVTTESGDEASGRTSEFDWPVLLKQAAALNANTDHGTHLFDLGTSLGAMLLPDAAGELFLRALAAIRHPNGRPHPARGLRLRIRCNNQRLAALPWEASRYALIRGGEWAALLLQPDLSLVRSDPGTGPRDAIRIGEVVQIATVDASRAVATEAVESDVPVFRTRRGPRFQSHPIPPYLAALKRELGGFGTGTGQTRLDMFHFSGHPAPADNLGTGGLMFKRGPSHDGSPQAVSGAQLGDLLFEAGVQLAVLSACNSGSLGSNPPVDRHSEAGAVGVALQVAKAWVPAVVAMQHRISDQDAKRFTNTFYTALRGGATLDEAVSSGRRALSTSQHRLASWVTPVLYLNSDSGEFLGPTIAAMSQSSPAKEDLAPAPAESVHRTRVQLARGGRRWWISAERGGLVRVEVGADLNDLPWHGLEEPQTIAVAADAKVVAQLSGGTLSVAWITRTTGALVHWATPVELFSSTDEARLLAVAMAGTRRVRCVISASFGTYLAHVDQFDRTPRMLQLSSEPSRAALLLPGGLWTVDPAGAIRERELSELLPRIQELGAVDAAQSGRCLLVAALGVTRDGNRVLVGGRTGEQRVTEESSAVELAVVRQLDVRAAPDCVVTSDRNSMTAHMFSASQGTMGNSAA